MQKKANILIWKIVALLFPLLIFTGTYLYYDPFRVIRYYKNYQRDCFVALNRDYVGTEVFLHNEHVRHYNSYILGNSRSLSFFCRDWKQYIPGSSPFHYDGSGESLKGVRDKIIFIDKEGGHIDHALLVVDNFLLSLTEALPGPTSEPHPRVAHRSWVTFHIAYFRSYLSEFYFYKYIDYYYTRQFKPYMKGIIETRPVEYDSVTNDYYVRIYDVEMENDPVSYIRKHAESFPARDTIHTSYTNAVVHEQQIKWLTEIAEVFKKHHTDYKIIVSPAYDQVYFNREDLKKLNLIFGSSHLYDFSGRNEYTRNIQNYYESFHYRPRVARDILKKIYAK